MMGYSFSFVVPTLDLDDEAMLERLHTLPFAAYPQMSNGVRLVSVVSEERNAYRAAGVALDGLKSCGLLVESIAIDFVTISDMSDRCDVSRETVRLWTTGARRKGFPDAVGEAGSSAVWDWARVFPWLKSERIAIDDLYDEEPLPAEIRAIHNGNLAKARMMSAAGWRSAGTVSRELTVKASTTRHSQHGSNPKHNWTDQRIARQAS